MSETIEKKTQARFRKSEGVMSKAARARAIIAEMNGKVDQKAIITEIQNRLGFTRAMARHYYYCSKDAVIGVQAAGSDNQS